jgi:hypothetical protein
MSLARFKVDRVHIDGANEATVLIDRESAHLMVTVKPKHKRHEYRLPLRVVAEMVAWKVAKEQARA